MRQSLINYWGQSEIIRVSLIIGCADQRPRRTPPYLLKRAPKHPSRIVAPRRHAAKNRHDSAVPAHVRVTGLQIYYSHLKTKPTKYTLTAVSALHHSPLVMLHRSGFWSGEGVGLSDILLGTSHDPR